MSGSGTKVAASGDESVMLNGKVLSAKALAKLAQIRELAPGTSLDLGVTTANRIGNPKLAGKGASNIESRAQINRYSFVGVAQNGTFDVGQEVRVRDTGEPWMRGKVTSVHGLLGPRVLVDGFEAAHFWDETDQLRETQELPGKQGMKATRPSKR